MHRTAWKIIVYGLMFCLLGAAVAAAAQQGAQPGRSYATPQEAVTALIEASRAEDTQALYKVLGPGSKKLIESGDAVADKADRAAFVAAYQEKNALVPDADNKNRYQLEIGADAWPFPIPLVSGKSGRWSFDAKAGAEALIARRIGHNELSAMQVCLAYADAQKEYYRLNPDRAGTAHYAARIASRPGQRDGLYWATGAGEPPSPLGALAAAAESGGYARGKQGQDVPYFGYRYRVLTRQGRHATGGERSYTAGGLMSGGFALLAYPAVYGSSGVMTFMINQDGVIYEKNLGKDTVSLARAITAFDPDASWHPVAADAL